MHQIPEHSHASHRGGTYRFLAFRRHRSRHPPRGRNVLVRFGPSPHRVLWPLLTPLQVAPLGSPQIRACCFPARPPHLPPRLNRRLRCVVPTRRIAAGLDMRFLSVSPPVSSSLPPSGGLLSRSWLRVVVLSRFHVWSSYRGLTPHLQRAHAGRAQATGGYSSLARRNPQLHRWRSDMRRRQ